MGSLERVAAVFGPPVALGLVIAACSATPALVAKGGECFLAADCEPGLVCVEQPSKNRQCTDDLSRVGGRPPAMPGDADPEAGEGGEGGLDDAPADGPAPIVDTGIVDTGRPDTGSPGPVDTGPPDTGPPDTGPPDVGASD